VNLPPLTELPQLHRVRQTFGGQPIADLGAAVRAALSDLDLAAKVRPGAKVAVTSGSRGVANVAAVTAAAVAELRRLGAEPFVIPAMGSHGSATAAGQAALLAEYGVTEASVGAPVISQSDITTLGESAGGVPLFADALAAQADGIVVINRIKPHTDFVGVIESGPTKMLAIGLGKWLSARTCHAWFVERGYEAVIRDVGAALWQRLPVLGGLGLVENGHHQTVRIGAVRPERPEADEIELLAEARRVFGYLPFERLDVLLVDRIGKDISGSGLDTNVTGRDDCKLHTPRTRPFIWRIAVRGLSPGTHGNATGIGNADFVLKRCAERIDWAATATNVVTAASPEGARCPIVCADDAQMLAAAFHTSGPQPAAAKRLVWIRDTLAVHDLWVGASLLPELDGRPGCEIVDGPRAMALDADGYLVEPW
jgi:hypothetical protein